MNIAANTKAAIDYQVCSYRGSRLRFRGPARSLDAPYVTLLGGSQSFGKFVAAPFADLLEAQISTPVVNLGVMQAGLTLFLEDPVFLDTASAADMTVLQVIGAQNMSNRFYSVHPRRNDRFLSASDRLQSLYPDVDFTEFNFTGHLLSTLEAQDADAFRKVIDELRTAWVNRMATLINAIRGPVLLLWMSDRAPEDISRTTASDEPLFVTRSMLDALMPLTAGLVEVVASTRARAEGLEARQYLPGEEAAAQALPGPRCHAEVADALGDALLGKGAPRMMRRTSAPFVFQSGGMQVAEKKGAHL